MTVLDRPPADADVLIEQARRRQRRRRRWIAAVAGLAVAGAGLGYGLASTGGRTPPPRPPSGPVAVAPPPPSQAPTVDYAALRGQGTLAVVSRSALWLVTATTTREVLPASDHPVDPAFSADGEWLSVTSNSNSDRTWVMRADGAGVRQLTGAVQSNGWSPRGHLLAVSHPLELPAGVASIDQKSAVEIVDPAHTMTRAVVTVPGLVDAVWSPTGADLAISSIDDAVHTTGVTAYPVTGGRSTPWYVTNNRNGVVAGQVGPVFHLTGWGPVAGITSQVENGGAYSSLDFSPLVELPSPGADPITVGRNPTGADDTENTVSSTGELALVRQTGDAMGRVTWTGKHIEVCPSGSSSCSPVTSPEGTESLDPAWSPDGAALAYLQAPDLGNTTVGRDGVERWYADHELVVDDAATGATHVVPDSRGASAPTWSADGTELLYSADNALWLQQPDSAHRVKVVSPEFGPTSWESSLGHGPWSSYYGQIDWVGQVAWSHAGSAGPLADAEGGHHP